MPQRDARLSFQERTGQYKALFSLIIDAEAPIVLSCDIAIEDLMNKKNAIHRDRSGSHVSGK